MKELRGLIKEIDREGLLFLIKQANTLIYNQRVEEINRAEEQNRSNSAAPKAEKRQPSAGEGDIRVEKGAFGRSFIVDFAGVRKTFDESEMLGVVQAAQAADTAGDGGARIYRWLKRNRDDVLLDAGIAGPGDRRIKDFWKILGTTFAVKNK